MDKFDESGRLDDCMAFVAAGSADEDYQEGAEALTAARNNVFCDLVHQRYRALEARADDAIDGLEVRLDERAYLFESHCYGEDGVAGGIHGEPHILADAGVRENGAGWSLSPDVS
jgi:hypothetical protein